MEAVRALQPELRSNQTLKGLSLLRLLGDEDIHLLVEALEGNATIEILYIGGNEIFPNGLDDIARLVESTRLQTIDLQNHRWLFANEASTQRFARILSRHGFLKD